jgi:hypothetical protein
MLDAALPPAQFGAASRSIKAGSARPPCGMRAAGTGAAAAANAALAALAANCVTATTAATLANLGPFADNGSCSYDCGFREQDWWWKANYVPYVTNAQLVPGIAQVNIGSAYHNAYQPTINWAGKDMAAYGASLTGSLALIGQIDAAIIQAGGQETPAQAAQLAAAFSNSGSQLGANLAEANQALQGLAGFLTQRQGQIGYLPALATSCQSFIHTDATNTENNLIGQIACGSGDVQNSFNAMLATIDGAFVALQPPFSAVNNNLQSALQAGQTVAGIFLILQSDSQLVSQAIAQAQALAPTDPLRQLRLNIAATSWNAFTTEANSQLLS